MQSQGYINFFFPFCPSPGGISDFQGLIKRNLLTLRQLRYTKGIFHHWLQSFCFLGKKFGHNENFEDLLAYATYFFIPKSIKLNSGSFTLILVVSIFITITRNVTCQYAKTV